MHVPTVNAVILPVWSTDATLLLLLSHFKTLFDILKGSTVANKSLEELTDMEILVWFKLIFLTVTIAKFLIFIGKLFGKKGSSTPGIYALKLCPLFLKILACKIGYNKIAGGLSTISLSNIGIVKTPKSMEEYIDNIEFIAAGASTTHSCCVASFNNVTKISVTRIFQELDIEKEFFKFLSQQGLEVIVSSNLWEEN